MKSFVMLALSAALVCGQPPQPPKIAPGTPAPLVPAPQPPPATPATPAPPVAPDSVVLDVGGKKLLTEAEAKAKIEDLRKQIVAGADFGKLARENSDDKTSAAKDGDFGIMKQSSTYPEPIKAAVFGLKAGEVSQPVRQPNGFYLIRVDEVIVQPFQEVFSEIYQAVKQERLNDYIKNLQSQYKVKVENPAYFSPQTTPQLQQVR